MENIAGVAILPESIWGSIKNPSTFTDSDPIGTGPWKLVEWKHDDYLLFAKNPNYFGGAPRAIGASAESRGFSIKPTAHRNNGPISASPPAGRPTLAK